MEGIDAYKARHVTLGTNLMDIAEGIAVAAAATAGLPVPLPDGVERPKQNLNDAAALSSTAQNILNAAYSCSHALAELEERFPTTAPPPAP
jgi:hypothetical protein